MSARWLIAVAGLGLLAGSTSRGDSPKPPRLRLLQGEDALAAARQQKEIDELITTSRFEDALKIAGSLAEFHGRVQGKGHWQAAHARWQVDSLRRVLRQEETVRKSYATLPGLESNSYSLMEQDRFREAVRLLERTLAIRRQVLGEDHPFTATSYNDLGMSLLLQGQYAAAGPLLQKALDIRRRVLGEDHPHTATSFNNLALYLDAQGRFAEAQPLYQKALDTYRKALGEDHSLTNQIYKNLAHNLDAQRSQLETAGRFKEALKVVESLAELRSAVHGKGHWQAVDAGWQIEALRRVLRQDEHAKDLYATLPELDTKAQELIRKGRYGDAYALLEKALAIRRQVLGEDNPLTATSYNYLGMTLYSRGQYAKAGILLDKALDIRRRVLGEDHPHTAQSFDCVARNLNAQARYTEAGPLYQKALDIRRRVLGEEDLGTAQSYNNVAFNLNAQARYTEAGPLYQKALDIRRRVLGDNDPETATSYNNVAMNIHAQARYAEAEPLLRKALDICRTVHGEDHPDTARGYNNLALNLNAQARYAEAGPLYQKALDIYRKVHGEDHPDTATSYNNVAMNIHAQARYAEAGPLYQKALDICRTVHGEDHPDTARGYNNLALNLNAQARYAEAGPLYQKALDIYRKVHGEDHPDTARGYNNLATCLDACGQYETAGPLLRKALDICRTVHGEDHPDTALGYNNLALNLEAQARYTEAGPLHQKALDISRKVYGEDHPETARGYNNLATCLLARGQYGAAGPLLQKALDIWRRVLGEDHPLTASSQANVGFNLAVQERFPEAELALARAARSFATARGLVATTGLERIGFSSEQSPLPLLAVTRARNAKPELAWEALEDSLARGTWDDLATRLRRAPDERAREAELLARLRNLDGRIEQTFNPKDSESAQRLRQDLLGQRRKTHDELTAFRARLEAKYGPVGGQVLPPAKIQQALPAGTALVGWLDFPHEHWAVVLRPTGQVAWVSLPGRGEGGAWTDEDRKLPLQLWKALRLPQADWRSLAKDLAAQRLLPLEDLLSAREGQPAVRHLVVLPSPALDGLPLEVLAGDRTISYAPSGTLYAHLRRQPRATAGGLLALADPVFDRPRNSKLASPLPPGGLLLTRVPPNSPAARAGLRAGDVLLRYAGAALKARDDLARLIAEQAREKDVTASVWRDGQATDHRLPPGNLGVVLAAAPAPESLAQRREADALLARTRAAAEGAWPSLPGTRAEAEAIRRLAADRPFLLLAGSQASEQDLNRLAKDGTLARQRYLHLATHGTADPRMPLRSAVILSRDRLPDPLAQLEKGLPVYDGRLTAEEVLEHWNLDADLVTLSACETALGKYERGEGFVGFAQAFLLAGSRSVCLSLWKVDDTATALLMARFYENLLGRREGLKAPLPKAEALREAKAWLRDLPGDEAKRLEGQLQRRELASTTRGTVEPLKKPAAEDKPAPAAQRPYAHPYYWSAFILVGDPG